MKAIVVGAGIVGLSVAWELSQRGASVSVVTADEPGSVQSVGETRVFRLSHRAQGLVSAAEQALKGWNRWEREFGVTLLDGAGLLITESESDTLAGTSAESVAERVTGRRHPLSDWSGVWWFEPTGAAGHIGLAVQLLSAELQFVYGQVATTTSTRVVLADGRTLEADAVAVCAGVNSRRLAMATPSEEKAYARFSYPIRGRSGESIPCWIQRDSALSEPFYSVRDGEGHFAIGLSEAVPGQTDADDHLDDHMHRVTRIVCNLFPRLEPTPVRSIRCVFPTAVSVEEGQWEHDGWDLDDHEGVIFVSGPNLFKFAPYLGELIADRLVTRSTVAVEST